MKHRNLLVRLSVTATLAALAAGVAISATDRYSLKVPGGLAFADFKGYEGWQIVNISQKGRVVAAILGNPTTIAAYQSGIPENGRPFPDGTKMAKIHWLPKQNASAPGSPTVGGQLVNVDFMVKDSKRFADSGGWGYAVFDYDAAADTFRPGDEKSTPPQAHDAKCGSACHTIARSRDFVFTEYPKR